MELNVFTSFSGYDSQCMALDRVAEQLPDFTYNLVGWSEIDPYAIQAHNLVYPQWADRNYGDISQIDWTQVPDFDFFTFSSPCQDFSNAGLQKGGEEGSGTRSSLLWECEKAIQVKKPKYMFMENVKALVSKKFIKQFGKWCERVESYGYRVSWRVINATQYNVPQNRERVFAVFIRDDINTSFFFPEPVPLTRNLKDMLEQNVEDKYYLTEESVQGFLKHNEHHEDKGTGFV